MSETKLTRGRGLLEPTLAHLRTQRANRLIPADLRAGRILDIGCGSFPYFLAHTSFQEKFAVDQLPMEKETAAQNRIEFFTLNLNKEPRLPFEDNFFSIVTLLAVVEHLDPDSMAMLFRESRRVLKPGGMAILTTPAAWSDGLLKFMARINLVSAEEIHEHAFAYTLPLLGWHFGQAGFEMTKVKFGYFEFMLNMWATARK
ncbi:MAG: class I SAM-dependent methyltransferase [Chloroflexi bacterium]|nr:class I SAM-dependent methyltransferase [Chloroflexota bacterium]MBI3339092.1 class I SAM-dependent methyltransferase [Chloroflexota bacterium]